MLNKNLIIQESFFVNFAIYLLLLLLILALAALTIIKN